ncbi:MAG: tetratricopeptide repeat protein [Bacteroidota bacterium]
MKKILFVITSASLYLSSCLNFNDHFDRGFDELEAGNYEKAMAIFEEGLKVDTRNPDKYHYGLGNCHYRMKNYEMAKIEFNKTVALNEYHQHAYWSMANIYSNEGDFEKAILNYDKAIHIENSPEIINGRGFVYLKMKNYEMALQDFNETIELDQKNAYAFNNRGLVHLRWGNIFEAEKDLLHSKYLDPDNPYVYKHLALLMLKKNAPDSACVLLNRSLEKGYVEFDNESDKYEVNELMSKHCTDMDTEEVK